MTAPVATARPHAGVVREPTHLCGTAQAAAKLRLADGDRAAGPHDSGLHSKLAGAMSEVSNASI